MIDAELQGEEYRLYVARIREIGVRYLVPKQNSAGTKDEQFVRYCTDAVEVLVSVATVFAALKTFKPGFVATAFSELTLSLANNTFWARHNASLTPIINSSMNSMYDHYLLESERRANPQYTLWDAMSYATAHEWTAIAPSLAYCIGGLPRMREVSLAMRKELESVV